MSGALYYCHRPMPGRIRHARGSPGLGPLAARRRRPRARVDRRATRGAARGLPLPPALRAGLLLRPPAQPLPAPLPGRPQGGPGRPPARPEPLRRLGPAGPLLQGGGPGRPPPPRRPLPRQALAALRRPHRPVPPPPPRGHPLGPARLYPLHLGGVRVPRGPAPLPPEVRPGPGRCRRAAAQARRRLPRPAPRRPPAAGPRRRPEGVHRRGRLGRTPGGGAPAGGRAPAPAGAGIFFAPTRYAGAFLLLPAALDWLAVAEDCFEDAYGSLRRGLLTSAFAPVVGLARVFHLDQMDDRGFALLSGGRSCPSRHFIGGWRRHLRWQEVDAFCRRTCPWDLLTGDDALVSFDDHAIPRWTRKFSIRKGYVTTRNKYMRCEKLFYGYHVGCDRYLCVRGAPGHVELRDLALSLTRRVLQYGRPRHLHALFDANAGKSDADVPALLELAD